MVASLLAVLPRRPRALLLLGGALCCGSAVGVEMKLLQWNIHGECFTRCEHSSSGHCDFDYPKCRDNSTAFLKVLLSGTDQSPPRPPDFASILQIGDEDFVRRGGADGLGLGQIVHTCGGQNGFGRWPFDIAVLYYDKQQWQPIGPQHGGCMEHVSGSSVNNYRAYAAQAFERKGGGAVERVVVAAAHYSHATHGLPELGADLRALMQKVGTTKLVVIADTNRECHTPSWQLLKQLHGQAGHIASSDLRRSCCFPHWEHCYDRIMATGFPNAPTQLPTTSPFGGRTPSWAATNMHDPMVARLSYSAPALARLI